MTRLGTCPGKHRRYVVRVGVHGTDADRPFSFVAKKFSHRARANTATLADGIRRIVLRRCNRLPDDAVQHGTRRQLQAQARTRDHAGKHTAGGGPQVRRARQGADQAEIG